MEEEGLNITDKDNALATMISLFYVINKTTKNGFPNNEDYEVDVNHVYKLLHVDEKEKLQIPVFSFILPTINT